MAKLFRLPKCNFGTKILLLFIGFIFIFLFLRFSLIIPKIEQQAYNHEIKNISNTLSFMKEQIKMATYSIEIQSELETKLIKEKIESTIDKLVFEHQNLKNDEFIEFINKSYIADFCSYTLSSKDIFHKNIKDIDLFEKNNSDLINEWQVYDTGEVYKSFKQKKKYLFYNAKLNDMLTLSLGCEPSILNPSHNHFEEVLRSHLQKNLSLTQSTHNSQTTFVWINHELANDNTKPLYEEDQNLGAQRYIFSNLSNSKNLSTGKLSAKEVLALRDKGPVEHKINNEYMLTWIINLQLPEPDDFYTLIYSIKKDDLLHKSSSDLFVLLPETFIAFLIALILIMFIFSRLFKDINALTQTAIKVKQGNKNIRSNVKGDDDIGTLGEAFDSMLNSLEDNIKTLDLKVEEKTIEIQKSLEEKETLLKEIHHRVKNNLAKTISLIELQEEDVKDKKTRKALVDIKERIYTMELLHRKLYESSNLNKIKLQDYITDLLQAILIAYNVEHKVNVIYELEDIQLDIEIAMPLGLVLNELVTNAIKYAFIDNNKPQLYIQLKKKEQKLTLIIQDNGNGLKEGFSYQNQTLGLKLVTTIVRFQFFGDIEYIYDKGTKFIITGQIKES